MRLCYCVDHVINRTVEQSGRCGARAVHVRGQKTALHRLHELEAHREETTREKAGTEEDDRLLGIQVLDFLILRADLGLGGATTKAKPASNTT